VLAFGSPDAVVLGLNDVPKADRPPVQVVHLAFQVMVACAVVMMIVALWGGISALRWRRLPDGPRFLLAVALASPLGMVAIEAGWTVTEVGRQPWIVHRIMRTAEAVTPVRGLWISMVAYTSLYLVLGAIVVLLLRMQFRTSPGAENLAGAASAGEGRGE
jgi:cytochrome d ubiquinol oxidase subunit I